MKTYKELVSEIYDYPPTTADEKKFIDLHTTNVVDYPVKNEHGLPFRDDRIKGPGPHQKKPASYDPPKEPSAVYTKANEESDLTEKKLPSMHIYVNPIGGGKHEVLTLSHDVEADHPSKPGTPLEPGHVLSDKDVKSLQNSGHTVAQEGEMEEEVNEGKAEDDAVKAYLAKGGKVTVGKTKNAKGIEYMRGMSRQKGSSPAAKMSYKEEVNLTELLGIDAAQISEDGLFESNDILSLLAVVADTDTTSEIFFTESTEGLVIDKEIADLILSVYNVLDEEDQDIFEAALTESNESFDRVVDLCLEAVSEELEEERMPPSVIKHKQSLSNLTDKEFAEKNGNKSEDDLRKMAASHGYGMNSDHYVQRAKRGAA